MSSTIPSALVCLALILSAQSAVADTPAPSTAQLDGRVQLGLSMPLANISFQTTRPQSSGSQRFQAHLGSGGIYGNVPRAVVGYGFSDVWLADLALSFVRERWGEDSPLSHRLGVEPGLAYVFGRGQSVRPFVGGRVHVGRMSHGDYEYWNAGGAVRGGAQLHLVDHLSVDPYLALEYVHTFENESSSRYGGLGGLGHPADAKSDGVNLSGGITLSVWL